MPIQHTNRRGRTYYLHKGQSSKGNPRYTFSTKTEGELVEEIPEGYEIYENPNGRMFLRRVQPNFIHDSEKAVVDSLLEDLKGPLRFLSEVKGKTIIVYESVENVGMIEETFRRFSLRGKKDIEEMIHSVIRFTPVMRFTLKDEEKRSFLVERKITYFEMADSDIGPADEWEELAGPEKLQTLVDRYLERFLRKSMKALERLF